MTQARRMILSSFLFVFFRSLLAVFLIFGAHAAEEGMTQKTEKSKKRLITIHQFMNHPALEACRDGLEQALKDRGLFPERVDLRVDQAQGNIGNAVQIAKHQVSFNPDFMVAIGTPSAQTVFKAQSLQEGARSVLAFLAVTDPKAAGLITEAEDSSNKTVMGVMDDPPVAQLVDVLIKIFPDLKTIGVLFNPGEINSLNVINILEKETVVRGLVIKKVPVTSSGNIKISLQKLLPDVDIIYLPQDNLVVSGIETVIRVTLEKKIPVVTQDPSLVAKGIFLGLGCDYYESGVQLGQMIADKIAGVTVDPLIQKSVVRELKINEKTARALGVTIPQDVKEGPIS